MVQIQRPILGKFIVMKCIEIKQIFSMFVELYIKMYKFNSNKLQKNQKINSKLLA